MTAARTIGGPAYPEMIEEIDKELSNVIEYFERAVYVEALRLADETSKLSFLNLSIVDPQGFGVARAERERLELVERDRNEQGRMERDRNERERMERERMERERMEQERVEQERVEREQAEQERTEQDFLFRRLKPVETGYHHDLRCMDGTRQSLLNQITDWVANKSSQENVLQRNAYWFYGSPGIGKTSLAHSICASLHERNHLAGAFFCRRDDPNLSDPINILPTNLPYSVPPFEPL